MSAEFANLNNLWSRVLVETLRRKGVMTAVICPGSRSSPLTFAFAREPRIEAIPALDERSAAFFALGLAKRAGKPVALLCTSGSAVANFFPAVVEASESGVPLIVLTADRPPELRDCSAGQTIDQVKIFGGYVRYEAELSSPEAALTQLRYLRQTVAQACDRSLFPHRGAVQINVPFRDPLTPEAEPGFESPLDSDSFDSFFSSIEQSPNPVWRNPALSSDWLNAGKGLILVGPQSPAREREWLKNLSGFANSLGWPVLADALNPARSREDLFGNLICGYEYILRNRGLREELQPERVIVVGSLPTSKTLRQWLEGLDAPMLVFSPRSINSDPTHSRASAVYFDFEQGAMDVSGNGGDSYAERWRTLDSTAQRNLAARMDAQACLFEGKLAWQLSRCLPEGTALCVSNSMPPRDLEFYFSANRKGISVYSSRGANGIDGILSTAIGVAHRGKPTYLLIGDLALLHDTNGALLAQQFVGSLIILLVNNSGGGIFEMLPVSEFEDVFEKHFATDQKIDFSNWARTYGFEYRLLQHWEELPRLLASHAEGIRILELRTDRKADAATRKRWFAELSQELG